MPMMPVSGVFYSSLGAIKSYSHENGDVYITHDKEFYAVHIIKQTSAYSEEYRVRGRMDTIAATEFFDTACRYLRDEVKWTEPIRIFCCKYNPNRSRACNYRNCPSALGGAAYWEIFAKNCPHRNGHLRSR